MLKDTAAVGALSESQAGLVDRALEFQRMTAADVMTPWPELRTVPADWGREQVVRLLSRERPSCVPVVERGAESRVVGVLRFEDGFLRAGGTAAALAREPARLPVRTSLPEAAVRVRDSEAGAGLVEEGGRVVGLITLADVLGPLIGSSGG
jgi:CBS domain containing-hemolysin-like protein